MRTLKLTVAYDGTRYAGWQVQESSRQPAPARTKGGPGKAVGRTQTEQKPTIQGTLERVLQRILQEPVKVVGSGRTDAGVHALAQAAHVKMRSAMSCARLLRSLNQLLPPDIAVTRLEEPGEPFHARFDARRKRYRYRIFTGAVASPFIRPYVHHVRVPLRLSAMRRELAALRGRHDFRAFARRPGAGRTTVRAVTDARLSRRGGELRLELEGNGFLHAMVRSIAGTLLDVGRGRLPEGTVRRMLKTGDRRLAGTTAPPRGLTLVSVNYARRHG
jgi:tRNA pseudouridine38-40 synthase